MSESSITFFSASLGSLPTVDKNISSTASSRFSRPARSAVNQARVNELITKEKAYGDSTRAFTDSALKYNAVSDSLPVKVAFTEFTPGEAKTTLAGTVLNKSAAAKSYVIKFEFLDKTGAVVAAQEVNVGPVQPNASAGFSATGTAAGIAAFRYAPLP